MNTKYTKIINSQLKLSGCVLAALVLLLNGCSQKEKLSGKREDIITSTAAATIENDKSPVILDKEELLNKDMPQPFLCATHCPAPLKLALSGHEIWSASLDFKNGKTLKIISAPVIAEEKIFCIDAAGIVYALGQQNGQRIWRTSVLIKGKDGQIGGAIAYENGKLIVTSSFSECFSLDAKNGKILWRIKLPAVCKGEGITVHNGKAFVMCANSSLQAIDINTGKILWSHSGTIVDSLYLGSAGVAIDDGLVFLTYPSGEIFALLEETGSVIWDSMFSKFSLTNSAHSFVHPRTCPVIKDDLVYFVASNEQTLAFNKKTGERVWISNFGGLQTPTVNGNSIFIFNSKSELVCLNKNNGKLRWISKLERDVNDTVDWYGQIMIGKHILMLSPTGKVSFVSPYTGKIEKSITLSRGDNISVNPVVANSIMYVLTDSGELVAYK
ncbi:MAG: PQQ-binding-like beta-propeller repeat protein [Holosporaceae bacterium]|jgi:outer membrane protein assembly factor BamB|nr:PQQ-binding-like beta-propeller repeat protein [Holosporaceae bacterium]